MKKIIIFILTLFSLSSYSQIIVPSQGADTGSYQAYYISRINAKADSSLATSKLDASDTASLSHRIDISIITDPLKLDSGEIKHLNSTPKTLVAAATGYFTSILNVSCYYDRATADYTGDSTLVIYYTGLGSYAEAINALDGSSDKMNIFIPAAIPELNKDLAVLVKSKTSNPVGATATGTVTIYITYRRVKIL